MDSTPMPIKANATLSYSANAAPRECHLVIWLPTNAELALGGDVVTVTNTGWQEGVSAKKTVQIRWAQPK